MVRPPKPDEVKQNIPVRKSILKTLKPDIEERYRTEAPVHKKIISDKLNIPSSSLQAKVKVKNAPTSPKTKPASPKTSKLTKIQSQQPSSITKRDCIVQSKSNTNKPGSPSSPKQGAKTRKTTIIKKKSQVGGKSDPMNRLLKIREITDPDSTSLPVGEQFISNAKKNRNSSKLNKLGKVFTGAKKGIKKNTRDAAKTMGINIKQEKSAESLNTHFPPPYIPNELTSSPNPSNKFGTVYKRNTFPVQKKNWKSKADQEDNTDAKNKKSKLNSLKFHGRVLSSDSVLVFSVREIKHNDSFIISARKLQKSTSERRDSKPDCLKLTARTSSFIRAKTDNLPLKSCLKKTSAIENKIGEHCKIEGKMRINESFYPTQII